MKIYWNNQEMEKLMQSDKISKLEQDLMMKKLDEIKAAFLQEFGFEGKFGIKSITTSGTVRINGKLHGGRTSFKVMAADKRTGATLKRNPKWLNRFVE